MYIWCYQYFGRNFTDYVSKRMLKKVFYQTLIIVLDFSHANGRGKIYMLDVRNRN